MLPNGSTLQFTTTAGQQVQDAAYNVRQQRAKQRRLWLQAYGFSTPTTICCLGLRPSACDKGSSSRNPPGSKAAAVRTSCYVPHSSLQPAVQLHHDCLEDGLFSGANSVDELAASGNSIVRHHISTESEVARHSGNRMVTATACATAALVPAHSPFPGLQLDTVNGLHILTWPNELTHPATLPSSTHELHNKPLARAESVESSHVTSKHSSAHGTRPMHVHQQEVKSQKLPSQTHAFSGPLHHVNSNRHSPASATSSGNTSCHRTSHAEVGQALLAETQLAKHNRYRSTSSTHEVRSHQHATSRNKQCLPLHPAELTRRLMAADTLDKLCSEHQQYGTQWDPMHVSAAICRFPKCKELADVQRQKYRRMSPQHVATLQQLLDSFKVHLTSSSYPARNLVNTLWTLSQLQGPRHAAYGREILKWLLVNEGQLLRQGTAQDVANLAYSASLLQYHTAADKQLWVIVCQCALLHLGRFKSQELANIAWAVARTAHKLKVQPRVVSGTASTVAPALAGRSTSSAAGVIDKPVKFVDAQASHGLCTHTSTSATGPCKPVGHEPPMPHAQQSARQCADVSARSAFKVPLQHVAASTSLTTSVHSPPDSLSMIVAQLFNAMAQHAIHLARCHKLTPQHLCNFAWAFAKVGLPHPQLLPAVSHAIQCWPDTRTRGMHTRPHNTPITPQGISNLLWSLATLKHQDKPLVEFLVAAMNVKRRLLPPQSISNICWSLCQLGYAEHQVYVMLVREAWYKVAELQPLQLATLCQTAMAHRICDLQFLSAAAARSVECMPNFEPLTLLHLLNVYASVQHIDIQDWNNGRSLQLKAPEASAELAHNVQRLLSSAAQHLLSVPATERARAWWKWRRCCVSQKSRIRLKLALQRQGATPRLLTRAARRNTRGWLYSSKAPLKAGVLDHFSTHEAVAYAASAHHRMPPSAEAMALRAGAAEHFNMFAGPLRQPGTTPSARQQHSMGASPCCMDGSIPCSKCKSATSASAVHGMTEHPPDSPQASSKLVAAAVLMYDHSTYSNGEQLSTRSASRPRSSSVASSHVQSARHRMQLAGKRRTLHSKSKRMQHPWPRPRTRLQQLTLDEQLQLLNVLASFYPQYSWLQAVACLCPGLPSGLVTSDNQHTSSMPMCTSQHSWNGAQQPSSSNQAQHISLHDTARPRTPLGVLHEAMSQSFAQSYRQQQEAEVSLPLAQQQQEASPLISLLDAIAVNVGTCASRLSAEQLCDAATMFSCCRYANPALNKAIQRATLVQLGSLPLHQVVSIPLALAVCSGAAHQQLSAATLLDGAATRQTRVNQSRRLTAGSMAVPHAQEHAMGVVPARQPLDPGFHAHIAERVQFLLGTAGMATVPNHMLARLVLLLSAVASGGGGGGEVEAVPASISRGDSSCRALATTLLRFACSRPHDYEPEAVACLAVSLANMQSASQSSRSTMAANDIQHAALQLAQKVDNKLQSFAPFELSCTLAALKTCNALGQDLVIAALRHLPQCMARGRVTVPDAACIIYCFAKVLGVSDKQLFGQAMTVISQSQGELGVSALVQLMQCYGVAGFQGTRILQLLLDRIEHSACSMLPGPKGSLGRELARIQQVTRSADEQLVLRQIEGLLRQ